MKKGGKYFLPSKSVQRLPVLDSLFLVGENENFIGYKLDFSWERRKEILRCVSVRDDYL